MIEKTFILLLFVVVFFFSRILIRKFNSHDYGVDLHFHFYNIRLIRENQNQLVKSIPRAKYCSNNSYPFLFHYLLSFMREDTLKKIERIFAPFLDSVIYFLIGILYIFQIEELNVNNFESISIFFFLTILFCPILTDYNLANFRNFHANPRVFSQFVFSLLVIVYLLAFKLSLSFIIYLIIPIVIILSMTSKFSNQLLVFLSVFLIFLSEYQIPFFILIGYLVSMIIFNKSFINIIKGQLKHSFWWYKYNLPQYLKVHRSKSFSLFFFFKNINKNNFINLFFSSELFLIKTISSHLLIFPILFCYINNFYDIAENQPLTFNLSKILFSLYVISIVVYQNKMTFLGEYYRYIEFFIFFEIYIFFCLAPYLGKHIIILFSFLYITFGVLNYIKTIKQNINTEHKNKWKEIKNGLRLIDQKENLIYCLSNLNWMVLFYSKKICIPFHACNMDIEQFGEKRFKDLYGNKNLKPTKDFEYLKKKYFITHVIAYKNDFKIHNNLFLNDYKKKITFNGKYISIVEL